MLKFGKFFFGLLLILGCSFLFSLQNNQAIADVHWDSTSWDRGKIIIDWHSHGVQSYTRSRVKYEIWGPNSYHSYNEENYNDRDDPKTFSGLQPGRGHNIRIGVYYTHWIYHNFWHDLWLGCGLGYMRAGFGPNVCTEDGGTRWNGRNYESDAGVRPTARNGSGTRVTASVSSRTADSITINWSAGLTPAWTGYYYKRKMVEYRVQGPSGFVPPYNPLIEYADASRSYDYSGAVNKTFTGLQSDTDYTISVKVTYVWDDHSLNFSKEATTSSRTSPCFARIGNRGSLPK